MKINRKNALKLWKENYGNLQKVKDFSGRYMAMSAYGLNTSRFGWDIDHVVPVFIGGSNEVSNLQCTNILTNSEKGNSFPSFSANGKNFIIEKNKTSSYKIVQSKDNSIPDMDSFNLGMINSLVKLIISLNKSGFSDSEISTIIKNMNIIK